MTLVDCIHKIPEVLRDKVSSITIRPADGGYEAVVSIAAMVPVIEGVEYEADGPYNVTVDVDALPEGVTVRQWVRCPDYKFTLTGAVPVEPQIRELHASGLLGPLDASRYDAADRVSWLVKPLRIPGRGEEIATVAEAAAELGVSERRVRTLCSEGRIVGARRVGRDWVIPRPIRVLPATKGPRATWENEAPS